MKEPFVLVCRRDHPLAHRKFLRWSDLARLELIGFSRHSGIRYILDHILAPKKVELQWFYEVNHLSASLGLVKAGIGVSILPRMAVPAEGEPTVVTVPVRDPVIRRTIGIVERRSGRLSPAAALFRDMLLADRKIR